MPHFTELVDLASGRLGGRVLFANDEFFAEKENLIRPEPAVFDPEAYTDRGKLMDGWESRRRRTSGHDFCVVALGLPGVVRGIDVDTSHFRGNYPEAAAVDVGEGAADAPHESLAWREAVPRSPLLGHSRNLFPVFDRGRATHVRLRIYPDGGVARLRVHGDVTPDWARLASAAGGAAVDLAALENGGLVVASSDAFFGSHQHLLMPGESTGMHDGWETKRSRRPGFDWVVVRLGTRGVIERAVIDTSHFKGNFPDLAGLDASDAAGASKEELLDARHAWTPLLPDTKLRAHAAHAFEGELVSAAAATHVRLRITPDGGVARLRLFGRPSPPEALLRLNAASEGDAASSLLRACGSTRWAASVAAARPFASHLQLLSAADDAFAALAEPDWLEAFRAHPRIGDRAALAARFASTRAWAEGEQAGALAASEATLDGLAAANRAYEERFSFIFIVCATGLLADQMLASVNDRLSNPRDIELGIAADEQRKITALRLRKLLQGGTA